MGWGDQKPGTGMQNYARPQKGSDEEGEDDPAMRGFAKFTLWGWLLTKLGKQAR
jgi:hypothetical protein